MYVCMYVCVTAKFLLLDRAAGIAVHSGAAAAGESRQQAFSPGQGMYVCINVLYTCVTNPCFFSKVEWLSPVMAVYFRPVFKVRLG